MRKARRMLGEMFFGPKDEAADAGTGLRITGDDATLAALHQVFDEAVKKLGHDLDEDLLEWLDDCSGALAGAAKSGTVTLPPFQATPGLDSFNDDQGPGPDSEEY